MPVSRSLQVRFAAGLACLGVWLSCQPALAAAGASPEISARVMPCAGECGVMQWGQLVIDASGTAHDALTVPTSMQSVDEVHRNAAGNVIVVGRTQNGVHVIEIVSPATAKSLAEFWTVNWGISPDSRFVAFTEMVATHGEGADYSDKMVYVYDTLGVGAPPQGWVTRPSTAIPVYPASLVREGRLHVLHVSDRKLHSVVSNNFKWLGPDSFQFMSGETGSPGESGLYVPTAITAAADGGWRNAQVSIGQTLLHCDSPKLDFDNILASCQR